MNQPHSDRNLLIGILALHLDVIDRDQLVDALSAWVLKKSQSLDAILHQCGLISVGTRDLLMALVDKHLELNEGEIQLSLADVTSLDDTLGNQLRSMNDLDIDASLLRLQHRAEKERASASSDGGRSRKKQNAAEEPSQTPQRDDSEPTQFKGPRQPQPSQRIGSYKLLQKIGEGGMGTVWMADQLEPVRRRVALKVIKSGMDSKQVIARFEAERQALAMMDHQNIAKVFDAGVTEDGQPYFAMELVQGISFTQYCDNNKLSLQERLELFFPVCSAIQHAHQKGIIHRDLKPSNVLVTLYDGKPVPKVIDFGLAKALQHEAKLTDKTMFTEFGQVVGTVQYMSPEQAEMNALDVDTRTDIYSLGVMLFELLTGSTPIQREALQEHAVFELLQWVKEKDPPRPSTRLSDSGDAITGISAQRKIEPKKLQQILRGEMDWIVMKALEKDRKRRYETAKDFASDLERYLNDEQVLARPPSTRYRIGKFMRRHRAVVGTTAVVLLLLLATTAISSWFALSAAISGRDAERERRRATERAEAAREQKERADEASGRANSQAFLAQQRSNELTASQDELEATLARTDYLIADALWDDGRVIEARAYLDRVPFKHRHFAWRLSKRQFMGSYMTCFGHEAIVTSVAFSPDGQQIASADGGGNITLWNARTGEPQLTLAGHSQRVTSVAFSPDSLRIASSDDDGTVRLWNATTGERLKELTIGRHVLTSVSFSLSNKLIAAGKSHGITIWEPTTGLELAHLSHDSVAGTSVFLSPDDTYIVSGGTDKRLYIWDTATGQVLNELLGHSGAVLSVSVSPEGHLIASGGDDGTIQLWDASTGDQLGTFAGHRGRVESVAFSPDGQRVASAGTDRAVRVWDVSTGKQMRTLQGHTDSVNGLTFSPDGQRIASVSSDTTVKLWDITTATEHQTFSGHASRINSLSITHDGQRIASGSSDNTVKVWNTLSGEELCTYVGHTDSVTGVCFSRDGQRLASSSKDRTLRVWDVKSGDALVMLVGHTNSVTSVSFSPDGELIASGSWDNTIKLWDASSGRELHSLPGHAFHVNDVSFSPDGASIASCSSDNTIKLWDAFTGEELRTLIGHSEAVNSVIFAPDGTRIASTSLDGSIKIWDVTTGQEVRTLDAYGGAASNVCFSADNRCIALGSGGVLRVWDAATGEELKAMSGTTGCVQFSPDGDYLAAATRDNRIGVWWAGAYGELKTLSGHSGAVTCFSMSPDGCSLVSGGQDGKVMLWDTLSGERSQTYSGHAGTVRVASFSPDGQCVASGSSDGSTKVWDATTGEEIDTDLGYARAVWIVSATAEGDMYVTGLKNAGMILPHDADEYIKRLAAGNAGANLDLAYSQDGVVYTRRVKFGEAIWELESSGEGVSRTSLVEGPQVQVGSRGRWLVSCAGKNIQIVDRDFAKRTSEKELRESKAKSDSVWHRKEAIAAASKREWYAETFHRAWVLKAVGSKGDGLELFKSAYQKLESAYAANGRELEPFLAPVVLEMLNSLEAESELN